MTDRSLAILVALTIALAACHNEQQSSGKQEPTAPKALASFNFRGLISQKTTLSAALKGKLVEQCSTYTIEGVKTTGCWSTKNSVGDVPVGRTTVDFEDGVFDWFSFQFSTDYFEQMVAQTSQVYGEPCSSTTEDLQNAYGAKFDGAEVRWCFAEGQLTVRKRSKEDYRLGEIEFFTDKPAKKAQQYKPATL